MTRVGGWAAMYLPFTVSKINVNEEYELRFHVARRDS
jgi:hypothetical protein